jgi:hypothetical protein
MASSVSCVMLASTSRCSGRLSASASSSSAEAMLRSCRMSLSEISV